MAHMVAPDSKDLFKRVVLQSGSLENQWAMDSPEKALIKSKEFAKNAGCENDEVSIFCLLALTDNDQ